jgi:hypothetical protein
MGTMMSRSRQDQGFGVGGKDGHFIDRRLMQDAAVKPGSEKPVLPKIAVRKFAAMIALHIEFGRWDAANKVIALAAEESSEYVAPPETDPAKVMLAELIDCEDESKGETGWSHLVSVLGGNGVLNCLQAIQLSPGMVLTLSHVGNHAYKTLQRKLRERFPGPYAAEQRERQLKAISEDET